jgi:NTE family protein
VENGEVLVDGGVIDGLPVGTMRAFGRGPVIGVNVSADRALARAPQQLECGSPWWLLGRRGQGAPGIVSLLMRAATVSSDAQAKAARGQVDLLLEPPVAEVDLLDWQSFRRAIDIGYDHTMRTLDSLPTPLFTE